MTHDDEAAEPGIDGDLEWLRGTGERLAQELVPPAEVESRLQQIMGPAYRAPGEPRASSGEDERSSRSVADSRAAVRGSELGLAVAVVDYSRRSDHEQAEALDIVRQVIDTAVRATVRGWSDGVHEAHGDVQTMRVRVGSPWAHSTLDELVSRLWAQLRTVNRGRTPAGRLRLRVALHIWPVYRGLGTKQDPASLRPGASLPARLLDSPHLRAVLQQQPDAQLAVIASDALHGAPYPGDGWVHTSAVMRGREYGGWITVPGFPMGQSGAPLYATNPVSAPTDRIVSSPTERIVAAGDTFGPVTDRDRRQ